MALARPFGSQNDDFGDAHNPLGTDGFEFVEFSAPNNQSSQQLRTLFKALGFMVSGQHRNKQVTRFSQGEINFLLNEETNGHPARFAQHHGPCVCALAFRVKNAQQAFEEAKARGAKAFHRNKISKEELMIPSIYGIGGSLLFFVDQYGDSTIYDNDFIPTSQASDAYFGAGLKTIDHLTHNVYQGHMNQWANFYEKIFNFNEIRFFNIKGQQTGLKSRAMTSPCGKIRIPINESEDRRSQINEYLEEYGGEGVQHIALSTNNIYQTVSILRENGIRFMDTPDAYYDQIENRLPNHGEPVALLQEHRILIDGEMVDNRAQLLLQIFTETVIGPIFFEIIQRKGDEGFGEGNFQALFEAIERDQIARGFLDE